MPKHVPTGPDIVTGPFPFSQVTEANGFVFLAGQVGNAPGSGHPVPGGIEAETRQMLEHVGRLNDAAGDSSPAEPPARATVGVTALAAEYRVEIEVLAAR